MRTPEEIAEAIITDTGLYSNVVRQILERAVVEARIGWSPDLEEKLTGHVNS